MVWLCLGVLLSIEEDSYGCSDAKAKGYKGCNLVFGHIRGNINTINSG